MVKSQRRHRIANVASYVLLFAASIFVLTPLLWIALTSFKTMQNIAVYPPRWIPNPFTVENYFFPTLRMFRYLWNSLYVSVLTILATLSIGAHAGYAAARYRFPGRNAFLFMILSTVMIPGIAVLVPYYLIAVKLGLLDTHVALIIVYTSWQVPAITWILRAFFETVPRELTEAAMVDGCSPWGAFYKVVLPSARPGLAASAILVFVYVWNEFLIAYTLTLSSEKRMLTTGLYSAITTLGINWGALTAGVTLSLVPVVLVFLFLQKHFIQGLTAGATKG